MFGMSPAHRAHCDSPQYERNARRIQYSVPIARGSGDRLFETLDVTYFVPEPPSSILLILAALLGLPLVRRGRRRGEIPH